MYVEQYGFYDNKTDIIIINGFDGKSPKQVNYNNPFFNVKEDACPCFPVVFCDRGNYI